MYVIYNNDNVVLDVVDKLQTDEQYTTVLKGKTRVKYNNSDIKISTVLEADVEKLVKKHGRRLFNNGRVVVDTDYGVTAEEFISAMPDVSELKKNELRKVINHLEDVLKSM